MRSFITTIRGAQISATRLIPAAIVAVAAACSDAPTAPARSAVAPEAPSSILIDRGCFPYCDRILYTHRTSPADFFPEVFAMNSDGTSKKKIADGEQATWSVDHKKIAYVNFSNNATYDIYTMNPDGSGVTQLTFFKSDELAPSWSPDRSKIAFASNRAGSYDIWIMQANGAVPVRLTTDGTRDEFDPAWSPDGKRIAYTSMYQGIERILVTDVTTKVTTIVNTTGSYQAATPIWSPDGKRIAFTTSDFLSCGIRITDASGSGNFVNIQGPGWGLCGYASFSPDGTKIVFQNVDEKTNAMTIMSVKADGTGAYTSLTSGFPLQDGLPVWSSR